MCDPIRVCISCKELKPRNSLIRFVYLNKKIVIIKKSFKSLSSRSAYICKNIECFIQAKKYKKLEKALKVNIPKNSWIQFETLIKF